MDEQALRWYGDRERVESTPGALGKIVTIRGLPPAQLALAWLLDRNGVVAPVVDLSRPHHLGDALAASTPDLAEEGCTTLEAPFATHVWTPRQQDAH